MAHTCIHCESDCYCGFDVADHHNGDDDTCIGCGCDDDGLNEPDGDADDNELGSVFASPESDAWVCGQCGCRNDMACFHPQQGPCFWVEPNLCSHCVMLKGDPSVRRPWLEQDNAEIQESLIIPYRPRPDHAG